MNQDNKRETGARKLEARHDPDPRDEISQEAAENTPPRDGMGLSGEVDPGDGRQPAPSPAPRNTSGAGPAIAGDSEDARAPRDGRQPGASTRD